MMTQNPFDYKQCFNCKNWSTEYHHGDYAMCEHDRDYHPFCDGCDKFEKLNMKEEHNENSTD